MSYDSTQDTLNHITEVLANLERMRRALRLRAIAHDKSKLEDPLEKATYDRIGQGLRDLTYGSEEYRAVLLAEQPGIQRHYANNDHHPEHFTVLPDQETATLAIALKSLESLDPQTVKIIGRVREEMTEEDITAVQEHMAELAQLLFFFRPFLLELLAERESRINGMSLLAVMEMLADWTAASKRHADGSIMDSLPINQKRFGISYQLMALFRNTLNELGWGEHQA